MDKTRGHVVTPIDTDSEVRPANHEQNPTEVTTQLPYTVLVVDDEMLVRNVTASLLRRAGTTLYLAEDAATALSVFEEHGGSIDAAIIDLTLGDMPGQTLAEKLRELQPNLRVMFMSGYSDSNLEGERTRFLPKPFRREQLLRSLQELITIDCK